MKKSFKSIMNRNNFIIIIIIFLLPPFFIFFFHFPLINFLLPFSSSSSSSSSSSDLNITIDVVYKYINTKDKEIINKRKRIKQTNKDKDNEELKYSLRSIQANIPWVNKIYIIMPNNHIPFIDESKEEVKNKIIYIKDKDILGFDSSSSITFEHNALKNLDKYNISKCFIYMNDDYFIGRPLKKKDFFYYSIKEKRYVPYIVKCRCKYSRNNYYKHRDYYNNNIHLLNSKCKHSTYDYRFQNCAAYIFLYKYFNNKYIITMNEVKVTWHNALPLNIDDLKEIYNMEINNYKYKNELMNASERNNKQLTFEIIYSFFILNKYKRKMARISYRYYGYEFSLDIKKNKYDLFVINKGMKKFDDPVSGREKIVMGSLFNKRSDYEKKEIEDGYYYIYNEEYNNMVMDCFNNKSKFYYSLSLSSFTGEDNQIFYIYYNNTDGYYRIRNKMNNNNIKVKYLKKSNKIISCEDGVIEKDNSISDRWNIIPYTSEDNKNVHFIHNEKCNKCINSNIKKKKKKNDDNDLLKLEGIKGDRKQMFVLERIDIK